MTINIEALIYSLDKPYQSIFDSGTIPYKTPPQGTKSDPVLTLKLRSEGIVLTFDNDINKILIEVSLELKSGKKKGIYPNDLPAPLKQNMSREWVHETFGEPDKYIPPRIVLNSQVGGRERFTIEDCHTPLTMCIYYDKDELVEAVTFLPKTRLRW